MVKSNRKRFHNRLFLEIKFLKFGQLFRLPFPLFFAGLFPFQKKSSTQAGLRIRFQINFCQLFETFFRKIDN